MYKNLRSAKKTVEAILIADSDVDLIETIQDKTDKENASLKRKKTMTQKNTTSNKNLNSTKRKVISSKAPSKTRQSIGNSKKSKKSQHKKSSGSDTNDSDVEQSEDENPDDDDFVNENKKKPTSLFEENKSKISNQQIFSFQTPKRKNGMLLKAENSMKNNSPKSKENLAPKNIVNSPSIKLKINLTTSSVENNLLQTPKSNKKIINCKTPLSAKFIGGKSPRTLKLSCESPSTQLEKKENNIVYRRVNLPKTPYSLRTKLKKRICFENKLNEYEDDESGSEFGDSNKESSSESSNSDSDEESDQNSSPENVPVQKKPRIILKIKNQNESTTDFKPRRGARKREISYIFKSDDYFTHKSGKQLNKTSNNTLRKTPQISRDKLTSILNSMKDTHEICRQELKQTVEEMYDEWILFLRENFNILLHGFGSKHSLINNFHKKMLAHSKVIVIHGFFPDLTLKEILESIMIDLLDLKDVPQDTQLAFEQIKKKLSYKSATDIFLIVHNIDGVALRGNKQQNLLAQLSTIPKLHIITSIDHINAPLLWDNSKLGQLNFVWYDVTNYSKYEIETNYESCLLLEQSSGKLVQSSIVNVYKSLNNNAKQIFMLIVENHLDNKKNKQYQGVSFKDLYSWCRKGFLVTSDLTLRTQLTEFLDHELIKWRNDKEHLYIPINPTILEDFKQKQEEN